MKIEIEGGGGLRGVRRDGFFVKSDGESAGRMNENSWRERMNKEGCAKKKEVLF